MKSMGIQKSKVVLPMLRLANNAALINYQLSGTEVQGPLASAFVGKYFG